MVIAKLKFNNVVEPFWFEYVDTAIEDIYNILMKHGVDCELARNAISWVIRAWSDISNESYCLLGTIGCWSAFEISVFDDFGQSDDLPFE